VWAQRACRGGRAPSQQEETRRRWGYVTGRRERRVGKGPKTTSFASGPGGAPLVNVRIPFAAATALAVVVLGATGTSAGTPGRGPASGRWSIQKAYPAAMTPSAVSCPTSSDCFALGRGGGELSTVIHSTTGGNLAGSDAPGERGLPRRHHVPHTI
jgi:hypothetical protein